MQSEWIIVIKIRRKHVRTKVRLTQIRGQANLSQTRGIDKLAGGVFDF